MLCFEPKQNRLLATLAESEYEQLLPHLELVTLDFKQELYKPHEPIQFVYFPLNGVVSLLTILEINIVSPAKSEIMAGVL